MKIYVKYEDSWNATNLIGNQELYHNKVRPCASNQEDLSEKNKNLGLAGTEVYPQKNGITENTIWGILYRLAGDVRPLHMIKAQDHYLNFLDGKISFKKESEKLREECLSFQNIGNRLSNNEKGFTNPEHPSSWRDKMADDNQCFKQKDLYQVLLFPFVCSPSELYELIVNGKFGQKLDLKITSRLSILGLVENAKSRKAVGLFSTDANIDLKMREAIVKALNAKMKAARECSSGGRKVIEDKPRDTDMGDYLYFVLSAVYLSFEELCRRYQIMKSKNLLTNEMEWKCERFGIVQTYEQRWHSGISARDLTFKDLIGCISSKTNVINYPIDTNEKEKKTKVEVSDGILVIELKISDEETDKFCQMIEEANISYFRVGKKGIAYIKEIVK